MNKAYLCHCFLNTLVGFKPSKGVNAVGLKRSSIITSLKALVNPQRLPEVISSNRCALDISVNIQNARGQHPSIHTRTDCFIHKSKSIIQP